MYLAIAAVLGLADVLMAAEVVVSPDGRNEIVLSENGGVIEWSVRRDGDTVIRPSGIAMDIVGRRFPDRFVGIRRWTVAGERATPIYVRSKVDLAANAAEVDLGGGWKIELIARNDGVAYRHVTAFDGSVTVRSERADCVFADDTVLYAGKRDCAPNDRRGQWDMPDKFHHSYEMNFGEARADAFPSNAPHTVWCLPLSARTARGTWFCVKDYDILDYPGWHLERRGAQGGAFAGAFPREPDSNCIEVTPRFRKVRGRLERLCETSGTRKYPWRAVLLASSACKLAESDLLRAIGGEPEGDFSWVRPGLATWDWWCNYRLDGVNFKTGRNTATFKAFVDFAAEYGIPYTMIDGGWQKDLDTAVVADEVDLDEVCRHAKSKGVKVVLWSSWSSLFGREEELFAKYAAFGVVGWKIDYFNRDDVVESRFLERVAKLGVKYRFFIDFHGCQPPNGLECRYPNVLNWEGVLGEEMPKFNRNLVKEYPDHEVRLLFTRFLAGSADFTPGAMLTYTREDVAAGRVKYPGNAGTRAHEMALFVCYFGPFQMMSDSPSEYRRWPDCAKFIAGMPTVWDETRFLSGGPESGGHAVVARRKGADWYVGAITGWEPREVEFGTSFLGDGVFEAEIFRDTDRSASVAIDYIHETRRVQGGDRLRLALEPGGGFALRFRRLVKASADF